MTHAPERYEAALEQMRQQSQIIWSVFGAFLVANTVLLAFVLNSLKNDLSGFQPASFYSALGGLVLVATWYGVFSRLWDYYELHIAQARSAEPPSASVLTESNKLRHGEAVPVGDEVFRIRWPGRLFRTRSATTLLMTGFAVGYIGTLIASGPWR